MKQQYEEQEPDVMEEEEAFSLKRRRRPVVYIMTAVFLVVFSTFAVQGFWGLRKALYREQSANLLRVMEKISQNIDTMFTDKWEDVDFLAKELSDENYASEAVFLNKMAAVQGRMSEGNGSIFVIDTSGICHTADGKEFRWNNNALLNTKEKAVWVTNIPAVEEDVDSMLFTAKLPYPIHAGRENTFTHVVMVTDMRSLDEFLTLKEYGDESATYIIHATGGHVYRQESSSILSGMYNVVAALEKCSFGYDTSVEELKDALAEDRSGCAFAVVKDVPCYVVYERLSINDWYAVMMVPETLAGGNTTGFMRYIIIFMAMLSFGVIVIIVSYMVINQMERREQDEQIKAALKKTAETMKKAAEAERNANEAKTNFLSSMSHDIRTPMNAIIGLTNLASRRVDEPEYIRECLKKIALSSDYLLTLINDILDISKVESGKLSLNPASFSLADAAANQTNIIRPQLAAKNQEFEIHIHSIRYEHVIGDELRLNQVYMNLLTNAVKYTPEGGRITVDIWEEEKSEKTILLTFSVSDTGIGMSEEFQKNMYTAFTRATDSRINRIQGTGLGLAICKQMVELMGGTIECKSAENEGTTFTVSVELEKSGSVEDILTLPNIRLLLADDDEVFLESASQTLSEMGAVVDLAENGLEAVSMVKEKHLAGKDYPLVILDWKMPDLDGVETIRRIREVVGEQVPILLVSAYDWTLIEKEAMEAGATGFISKPFFRSSAYREIMRFLKESESFKPRVSSRDTDLAGMHLLIAEDIELNYEIISEMLESYGITTELAENGRVCVDTVNAAPEGRYDMILMDVQMPVLNGRDAAREIRKSEREWVRTIPIIAMTADAFAEDIRSCLDAGMDSHVAKPVDLKKLFRELRRFRGTRHGE